MKEIINSVPIVVWVFTTMITVLITVAALIYILAGPVAGGVSVTLFLASFIWFVIDSFYIDVLD